MLLGFEMLLQNEIPKGVLIEKYAAFLNPYQSGDIQKAENE